MKRRSDDGRRDTYNNNNETELGRFSANTGAVPPAVSTVTYGATAADYGATATYGVGAAAATSFSTDMYSTDMTVTATAVNTNDPFDDDDDASPPANYGVVSSM